MMQTNEQPPTERPGDDLGYSGLPLCREPWESYYILRRGIMPCTHGNPVISPMTAWEETWNSHKLQEIRSYLSRGMLSPYCLDSLGCPIVQKYLREESEAGRKVMPRRPRVFRIINRLMFRVPGRVYRVWHSRRLRQRSAIGKKSV